MISKSICDAAVVVNVSAKIVLSTEYCAVVHEIIDIIHRTNTTVDLYMVSARPVCVCGKIFQTIKNFMMYGDITDGCTDLYKDLYIYNRGIDYKKCSPLEQYCASSLLHPIQKKEPNKLKIASSYLHIVHLKPQKKTRRALLRSKCSHFDELGTLLQRIQVDLVSALKCVEF